MRKKAWEFLNGNKTIICLTAATAIQQAIKYGLVNDSKELGFALSITLILGGGSVGHHIKKGYFSRKKGN